MEDTLWIPELPLHAIVDTPDLELVQGHVRLQEAGISRLQNATKIKRVNNTIILISIETKSSFFIHNSITYKITPEQLWNSLNQTAVMS